MKFGPRGEKLIERYGYNFRALYRGKFTIRKKRMTRIFRIYQDILNHGEIDERTYTFEGCSRQTLLKDLHLLERLGLIECNLDFGEEVVPFSDCFIRK